MHTSGVTPLPRKTPGAVGFGSCSLQPSWHSGCSSADEQPLCQLGCNEQDPNPTAPGVFLGSGVTPDVCIMGGQTDADQDDLGDFCEKNLAFAFAPEIGRASCRE